MGLYSRFVLPRIVHYACGLKPAARQREKVVPLARGRVLEVGFGSGLNLPYYDASRVEWVWGLDPSAELWAFARRPVRDAGFQVDFVLGTAEAIPLRDRSMDTVLTTYAMCSIPDLSAALREMARVLRPDGELLFCEHGLAPQESVRRWQNLLNPAWKAVGGGCNLNRPIPALLESGGFHVRELCSMYIPGWRPASFNYWGRAAPA